MTGAVSDTGIPKSTEDLETPGSRRWNEGHNGHARRKHQGSGDWAQPWGRLREASFPNRIVGGVNENDMTTENFVMVCIFSVFVTAGVFLLFFPHKIVQFQGFFYRRIYKDHSKKTDEEIDAMYRFPTRSFGGKPSEFIRHAEADPRRYTGLIRWYRILGFVMLVFLLSVGSCIAIETLSGRI